MKIALVHDHYDNAHLVDVVKQMQTLGAPRIRAVWVECYAMWAALEGCHRLRAAQMLGLRPEIIAVDDLDANVCNLGLDIDDADATVGDVVDGCYRRTIITYTEED